MGAGFVGLDIHRDWWKTDGVTYAPRHAVSTGLTSRRHVDYGRVRSAICLAR